MTFSARITLFAAAVTAFLLYFCVLLFFFGFVAAVVAWIIWFGFLFLIRKQSLRIRCIASLPLTILIATVPFLFAIWPPLMEFYWPVFLWQSLSSDRLQSGWSEFHWSPTFLISYTLFFLMSLAGCLSISNLKGRTPEPVSSD
ncbi:hypothetical protein [Ponticaulis profundi]|uniref:hypothetical protein n=1 Tax=Ponticaulis profundi TaxID=2665222 RepID=UPI003672F512